MLSSSLFLEQWQWKAGQGQVPYKSNPGSEQDHKVVQLKTSSVKAVPQLLSPSPTVSHFLQSLEAIGDGHSWELKRSFLKSQSPSFGGTEDKPCLGRRIKL